MSSDILKVHAQAPLSASLVQSLLAARKSLPGDMLFKTRLHIADALGIATAARPSELARFVLEGQKAAAGDGVCQLIGGGQASAMAAAFINSSLIHILDYDDIHDVGRLHPATVILPAVLAAAELVDASDQEIIEAVALGNELICRLGVVCAPQGDGPGSEWFLTQLLGYIAASFAAGLVLGLSPRKLVSSIGLAYMQAAGGKQAGFGIGSNGRAIYPAFAAQGGVQAALLARAGMDGPEGALDGAASLFQIYLGRPLTESQREALLDFSSWHFLDVDIKPWPSCRLSHPYVAAGIAARDIFALQPAAGVRVAVNASAARLCRPLQARRQPETLQDAKYSIPFMTAFALVHGAPSLASLNDSVLSDKAVLDMAARVQLDEGLADNPGHPAAVLTLEHEGNVLIRSVFKAADLEMDETRIRSKFIDCFRHGAVQHNAQAAWQSVLDGRVRAAIRLSDGRHGS
ncbi:MAG TPA: MmgE/PrpD family protein [Eoetvoesiella sp.]